MSDINDTMPPKFRGKRRHERETARQAAMICGMSHETYRCGVLVLSHAIPELQAAVKEGKIGVITASKLARLPAEQQLEAARGGRRVAAQLVRVCFPKPGGTIYLAASLESVVNTFTREHPETTDGQIAEALEFVLSQVRESIASKYTGSGVPDET